MLSTGYVPRRALVVNNSRIVGMTGQSLPIHKLWILCASVTILPDFNWDQSRSFSRAGLVHDVGTSFGGRRCHSGIESPLHHIVSPFGFRAETEVLRLKKKSTGNRIQLRTLWDISKPIFKTVIQKLPVFNALKVQSQWIRRSTVEGE